MHLVVGAHPQNPSLSVLARRPQVRQRLETRGVTFFEYAAGAHTIPLVRAGVLQIAGTGATPPILAKAGGLATAAFAIGPPRLERGGLIVRAESSITKVTDLVGRGIGLMPISWHVQFLAAELAAAGLQWTDVRAAEINPPTAKDAFLKGLLDVMVATDPLLSDIEGRVPVRILAQPGHRFSNRTVFWATHDAIARARDTIRHVLDELIASDAAIASDTEAAAELLHGVNGWSGRQWLDALTARSWQVSVPTDDFLAEQQSHADLFAQFGLIPRALDVTDTVDKSFFPSLS